MARYIDADKLIVDGWHLERQAPSGKILSMMSIADVPTADVVEVTKVVEMLCKIKTNIIKNVSTMIENDFSEIVKDALGERSDT